MPFDFSGKTAVDAGGTVYVSNGWNNVRAYNVNASGVGVELPGSPYVSTGYAHTIRVNSAGTLLFTASTVLVSGQNALNRIFGVEAAA